MRGGMSEMRTIEGDLTAGSGAGYVPLASRFNDFIVDRLVQGAHDVLRRHGVSSDAIELVRAPGAFELPLVAQGLAAGRRYQAVIALGAVIRGSTPHFEYIAGACINGLAEVAL